MKRRVWKTVLTLMLVLGGLSGAACALPYEGFTLLEWWRESRSGLVLFRGRTPAKVVALTFDDGPDPIHTPAVLAILKRYDVKATFFEIGRQVQAHPELTRRVLAAGHTLGNHTYTHAHLEHRNAVAVCREMREGEACLACAAHIRTHLFRPPRGNWTPTVFREARREHDHIILWTIAGEHHEAHTPRQIARRLLRGVRPGAILLLHDGSGIARDNSVRALPLLLDGLRRRGYRCVLLPELLHIPGNEPLPPARQPAALARK